MDDQIVSFIDGVKSNKQIASMDEAAIKQTIVMRLLFILGWDIFNVDEVNSNYKAKNQPIDYALMFNKTNTIFISVKKIGKALDKSQLSLLEYASKEGVAFTVFTDGLLWWFYLTLDKDDLEQKNFCSLDFQSQKADDVAGHLQNFLAKELISKGKALELAGNILKKRHLKLVEETLPEAWIKILTEPPDALVDLLIETTKKICGYAAERDAVIKFLTEDLNRLQLSDSSTTQKMPEPGLKKETEPKKKPEPQKETAPKKQPEKKTEPEPDVEPEPDIEPEPDVEPEPEIEPEPEKSPPPPKAPKQTYVEQSLSSFTFKKKVYRVKSWSDMVVKLCEILQSEHKKDIKSLLWHSVGDKYYFSKNMNELRFPEQIGSTGIFLQTHMAPNEAVKVAYSIVSFFGYSKDDFSVSAENK